MKKNFDQERRDDIATMANNSMISVTDVVSMHRRKPQKNDKPYTKAVTEVNNELVEEWREKMLLKICNGDCQLPAIQAAMSLQIFLEGKELTSSMKHAKYMPDITDEQMYYWINFLKKDISELRREGTVIVSIAWQLIHNKIKTFYGAEKVKRIYSQSNDPKVWMSLANSDIKLTTGKLTPFELTEEDIKDMKDKVNTILSVKIEPIY